MLSVLVSTGFQVLFHSPPGVLFTVPSQYFSTIGHQVVFRLGGWSPHFLTGFLVPADTPDTVRSQLFRLQDSHPLRFAFPHNSTSAARSMTVLTPYVLLHAVWPLPLSLATTRGISVDFFSSPYLDVSVQAVPLICLCFQHMMSGHDSRRIAPFGNLWINVCLRLPIAYRCLLRPSSALSAKAFPLRSL